VLPTNLQSSHVFSRIAHTGKKIEYNKEKSNAGKQKVMQLAIE
jgi:hypothetical protein